MTIRTLPIWIVCLSLFGCAGDDKKQSSFETTTTQVPLDPPTPLRPDGSLTQHYAPQVDARRKGAHSNQEIDIAKFNGQMIQRFRSNEITLFVDKASNVGTKINAASVSLPAPAIAISDTLRVLTVTPNGQRWIDLLEIDCCVSTSSANEVVKSLQSPRHGSTRSIADK